MGNVRSVRLTAVKRLARKRKPEDKGMSGRPGRISVTCYDIQDSRLTEDRNDVSLFVQSIILQNGRPPTSSQSGWGLRPSNCEIWKLGYICESRK